MRLLEPQIADAQVAGKEKEARQKITGLIREENDVTKSLNKTREESEREKKRIKEETDQFVADQKKRALSAKREADSMESYRRDVLSTILLPINELKKDAKESMKEALAKLSEADKRSLALERRKEALGAKETELIEKEKSLNKIIESFEVREKAIDTREREVKAFAQKREKAAQVTLAKARKLLELSQKK